MTCGSVPCFQPVAKWSELLVPGSSSFCFLDVSFFCCCFFPPLCFLQCCAKQLIPHCPFVFSWICTTFPRLCKQVVLVDGKFLFYFFLCVEKADLLHFGTWDLRAKELLSRLHDITDTKQILIPCCVQDLDLAMLKCSVFSDIGFDCFYVVPIMSGSGLVHV